MRRTIIVLSCLAAIGAAAGCGSASDGKDVTGRSAGSATVTPQPPAGKPSDYPTETVAPETTKAGPKTFPMGYKATITDDQVGDVLYVTVDKPRTVVDEFQKPEKGRFLAVTVTFEALAAAQDINPYDFVATTADGERIDPTFITPSGVTELNSATLNSGEKAKGAIVFDVPKTGVTGVAYAPAQQILGTWKL